MPIYKLSELVSYHGIFGRAPSTSREFDGQWLPARPMDGPRIWRWKAAWAVLTGRADAFTWPGPNGQRDFI